MSVGVLDTPLIQQNIRFNLFRLNLNFRLKPHELMAPLTNLKSLLKIRGLKTIFYCLEKRKF